MGAMRHKTVVWPMMTLLTSMLGIVAFTTWTAAQVGTIPAGFTRIFDAKTTAGWHWSRTVHHGTTSIAKVEDGALVLQPYPFGQGGLLLTDKSYRDFELYLEMKPDPNYNSGIFLRSTEGGSAYQIELQVPGNSTGRL